MPGELGHVACGKVLKIGSKRHGNGRGRHGALEDLGCAGMAYFKRGCSSPPNGMPVMRENALKPLRRAPAAVSLQG